MPKQTSLTAAAILLCSVGAGCAQADSYLTVGGYYSKVSQPVDRTGPGSQIGIGYSLTEQWSLELGYDQLMDEDPLWPSLGNNGSSILYKSGYKSSGVTFSVLGKSALDNHNTLFYRVGAINHKSESWVFHDASRLCAASESEAFVGVFGDEETTFGTVRGCTQANSNIGLLLGFGVDNQFYQQWFSRIEVVAISDPDAETIYALKLGIGYRF